MQTEPRVSIALATYDGARFLAPLLDSLLRQSLPVSEIVVSDDASRDDTPAILRRYSREHPTLHLSENPGNLGFIANFERAIRACSGDLILLCDQDDVWFPQKVAAMTQAFAGNPAAGLVFCNARVTDAAMRPTGQEVYAGSRFGPDVGFDTMLRGGRHLPLGCTMGFHRRLVDLAIPFPSKSLWGHDHWIALLSAATTPVLYLSEPLMAYRRHAHSAGSSHWLDRTLFRKLARLWKNLSADAYARDALRWRVLAERLAAIQGQSVARPVDPIRLEHSLKRLGTLLEFSDRRAAMWALPRRERLACIRELHAEGRYAACARGLRTVLKDLLCLAKG